MQKRSVLYVAKSRKPPSSRSHLNAKSRLNRLRNTQKPVLKLHALLKKTSDQSVVVKHDEPTHRRLGNGEKAEAAQYGAQRNFHLFHGEPHADTVAWTHSERHERVRVRLYRAVSVPPASTFNNYAIILSFNVNCNLYLSGLNVSGSG